MDSKDSDQTEWMRRVDMSHRRADILYLGENVTSCTKVAQNQAAWSACVLRGLGSAGESSSLDSLLAVNLEMLWIIRCHRVQFAHMPICWFYNKRADFITPPLNKNALFKVIFLISQPKHIV